MPSVNTSVNGEGTSFLPSADTRVESSVVESEIIGNSSLVSYIYMN